MLFTSAAVTYFVLQLQFTLSSSGGIVPHSQNLLLLLMDLGIVPDYRSKKNLNSVNGLLCDKVKKCLGSF